MGTENGQDIGATTMGDEANQAMEFERTNVTDLRDFLRVLYTWRPESKLYGIYDNNEVAILSNH